MFRKYKGRGRKTRKANRTTTERAADEKDRSNEANGQDPRSRMRTKNMARDVIFIHGTLSKGKTEDVYEVSAQNITSFGVWILLPITGRGHMASL